MSSKITFSVLSSDKSATCGHNHRSLAAAAHCYDNLRPIVGGRWGNGGSINAKWFYATVQDSTGRIYGVDEMGDAAGWNL
ncbi:MAG TPA: hypothetical protein VMQ76_13415 [Terracidiphilus sp.]|jgi:hypothetical protein|nr:hypothetical protein [Terracidiphilus sp.]